MSRFLLVYVTGLIAGGLFGLVDETAAMALVALGAVAGGAWMVGLLLTMILAPTYAARIVYYPMSLAMPHPFGPARSLTQVEREAKAVSHWTIGLSIVTAIGYFIWTRWLGAWTVLTGYLMVLAFLLYKVFGAKKPWTGWSLTPTDRANMLKDEKPSRESDRG